MIGGSYACLCRWYEDNEPESIAIPDYENRILEQVQKTNDVVRCFGNSYFRHADYVPRPLSCSSDCTFVFVKFKIELLKRRALEICAFVPTGRGLL